MQIPFNIAEYRALVKAFELNRDENSAPREHAAAYLNPHVRAAYSTALSGIKGALRAMEGRPEDRELLPQLRNVASTLERRLSAEPDMDCVNAHKRLTAYIECAAPELKGKGFPEWHSFEANLMRQNVDALPPGELGCLSQGLTAVLEAYLASRLTDASFVPMLQGHLRTGRSYVEAAKKTATYFFQGPAFPNPVQVTLSDRDGALLEQLGIVSRGGASYTVALDDFSHLSKDIPFKKTPGHTNDAACFPPVTYRWECAVRLYEKATGKKIDGLIAATEPAFNAVSKSLNPPKKGFFDGLFGKS